MFAKNLIRSSLLTLTLGLAVAACSDSSTEIASPGNSGPNPGVGGSSGGGSSGGGSSGGGSAGNCPSGTDPITVGSETHCELSGTIVADLELTAENIYALNGTVYIGDPVAIDGTGGNPAILTIEAGTTIYGQTQGTALVISRGSQIEANGTPANPIIMTSAQDLGVAAEFGDTQRAIFTGAAGDDPNTAEWGGLVINGLAPINVCGGAVGTCEKEGEGDSGLFGGNDPDDSSGNLNYVVVKYAGFEITPDDELNGVAFQGVGRGTEVDFLQVHNGADDGVEFFGGTVEVKHVIISGANDDSMDWTDGWQGKAQFVLIVQNRNLAGTDRGIEADNLEGNPDFEPRSLPLLSNLTFIGAASADPAESLGDTGILLRRGTGARIWNAVVSNWTDACFDLDDQPTFDVAGPDATTLTGDLTMESTLLDCDDATDDEGGDPYDLETWFLNQSNNVIGASSLNGFVNGPAEAAVTATDPSAVDAFFTSVDYIGAVNSADAPDNWTLGWSFGLNPDPECPNVSGVTPTAGGDGCILQGTITEDLRLVAGLDYFLRGSVFIGVDAGPDPSSPAAGADPATITIDPGVVLQGENTDAALFIQRGSRIIANGTQSAPIVMTAVNDDTRSLDTDTALWGGLVINGRAPINVCGGPVGTCEKEGEGDSGEFGGNDPDDDSGSIRYVVVKYAGFEITPDDELNGVAFQGVGRGTTVDFLQVHNGADDGVEFFGGTVEVKHVVITGANDDSMDWTDGWQGKAQFVLIIQNANQPATDRGIEADNLEGNPDFEPRSLPQIANLTVIGVEDQGVGDTAILLRRGTGANLWNVVATNWLDACFDLDDTPTFDVAGPDASTFTGDLTIESALFDCTDATDDEVGDPYDLETWFLNQSNNTIATASTLQAPAGGGKAYINGANEAAATATDPSAVDDFFTSVDYIGAVESEANDWTAGWTVWLDQ